MITPRCSQCHREIPSVDVNVADNVAFCRSCNLAHKLSGLVHGVALETDIDLTRPPAGAWYRSSGLGAVVGATHRSLPTAIGLLFMSLFWNGIVSIFLALVLGATLFHLGIAPPEWFRDLKISRSGMGVGMTIFLWIFLTPFIAIGLGLFAGFFSALFGRTEVRVHHGHGNVFSGVGPLGRNRRFNPAAVKEVRIENERWRDSDGDRRSRTQIVVETEGGKQLKFGSMLRPERMKFVAAALRKVVAENT